MRFPGLVCAALCFGVLCFPGCSNSPAQATPTYAMGDRVELGHLVYRVLESRWLPEIGEGPAARVPQNRFFLIRLSVSNSGKAEALVPNMTIEDDRGGTYPELANGDGVSEFLSVLKPVTDAKPVAGNALFDAPPGHYKLRMFDEDGQQMALVDIPLSFRTETPEFPTPAGESK